MQSKSTNPIKTKALCIVAFLFVSIFDSCSQPPVTATDTAKRKIKLALLLDTSNSMDGLINQAKSDDIINESNSSFFEDPLDFRKNS